MTPTDAIPSNVIVAGSSLSEPTTPVLAVSSDATAPGSTSTSSMGWTRAMQQVDLDSLSPRSKSISLLIGKELTDGYKLGEIARELKQSPSWVSERLDELRSEILLNTGHFLPLSDAEFDALKESVREHGVRTPVLIGEHQLIDGRHRWLVSQELGLDAIPAEFIFGLTADQEHDIAVAVNTARRHLTGKQKRMVIRGELVRDWSRSSRVIAAICGVSQPTVEDVRDEMRREAETEPTVEQVEAARVQGAARFTPPPREQDVRVDATGRAQPAYVQGRSPITGIERHFGFAACGACGAVMTIIKVDDDFKLVHQRD